MSRYSRGLHAETAACLLLRLKGYSITGRRLRTPMGEIDVLASRGKTLAVIEVKQRASHDTAAGSISRKQQERLVRAARFVLAQRRELGNHTVRFDAILVNRWGWPKHLENVWAESV